MWPQDGEFLGQSGPGIFDPLFESEKDGVVLKVTVETFRKLLEAKRRDLLSGTFNRDDMRIENTAEDFDRLQLRMNRELAIRSFDRESTQLKDVMAALARIEAGNFGSCLDCEEEIPEKRLKALPWASHCVSCQEKLDVEYESLNRE